MIPTPSLRGRVMLLGITVVVILTSALDAFVFLSLRERLRASPPEIQAVTAATEQTLQRLLVLEIVGTVAVLLVAVLVLRRVSALITRPVEQIVQTANAIVGGQTGERLRPSDPSTELGRMAVAFDRTVEAMDQALSEARDAQDLSRRFLSDAAHQLRTPLAGLRASVESLLRDPESRDRDVILANVARESVRASRLVDSLLQVAWLERGKSLTLADVDLLEVVREERERAIPLAPLLTITLESAGEDFTVSGDRRALRDAVANLLDNARRFARAQIVLSVRAALGAVHVTVSDDGPGIPEGAQERVFDRFVTFDDHGSGLGLAIARAIARSHGGDLTAHHATFELLVPRARIP